MYSLQVFYPRARAPRAVVTMLRATDVSRWLTDLLADHPGCDRIVAHAGVFPLFTVNSKGDAIIDDRGGERA
jgi:hypothetical protein